MRNTFLIVLVCSALNCGEAADTTPPTPEDVPTSTSTAASEEVPRRTPTSYRANRDLPEPEPNPGQALAFVVLQVPEQEVIVFKGKYFSTRGPCVSFGGGHAISICDAFEVTEVLEGKLAVNEVVV